MNNKGWEFFERVAAQYLTTREAAEVAGVSVRTLERLRQKGKGAKYFMRSGDNKILYRLSSVLAWRFCIEDKEVRCGGVQFEVCFPIIACEIHLCGKEIDSAIGQLNEAYKRIRGKITLDAADGEVWSQYYCMGLKAKLDMGRKNGREYLMYVIADG